MLYTSACTIVTKRAIELVFGVGFSIGPIIGEALYVVGGFRLPFFVLGGLIFTVGLLLRVYFRLEGMNDQLDPAAVEAKGSFKKQGFFKLLMQPCVALQTLALLHVSISISFINAVLEPHLGNSTWSRSLSEQLTFSLV